jgi:CHAT domain-containing protein
VARYRRELGRLPSAREEARVVRRQFGDRSRILLGEEATEGAVRRELPRADLGHFACHAVVDEALPMDSALVLAPTEGSTGLLHAWEIVEDLELDADLVVLSACQTARGGERAGEGIVGLVRALQIARNVLATLWNVSDESTAVLMERFYRHLTTGDRPAAALRRAQLDLLRGPVEGVRDGRKVALRLDAARHWAPFVLLGVAD